MIKNVFTIGILVFVGSFIQTSKAQSLATNPLASFDVERQQYWVDSIYKSLSWSERIGQLFMVAAYSNGNSKHRKELNKLVKNNHIGGLIFMQGGPERQAQLNNQLQSIAKVPLLIGMDLEWGLNMQLDSTLRYPNQLTLGAISNDSLIYQMGADIAQQMKTMGIHLNFAPVININNNAQNPAIGFRSFGEDKYQVAEKAAWYTKGLQEQGVLACAKHFLDHGDIQTDSHLTPPEVNHFLEQLDSIELYPFSKLINSEVSSIMSTHLHVPAIDSIKNVPTSLPKKGVSSLVKNKMSFNGLAITDVLNRRSITGVFSSGKTGSRCLSGWKRFIAFFSKCSFGNQRNAQSHT